MFLSDPTHGSSPPTPLGQSSSMVNTTPREDAWQLPGDEEQGGQPSTTAQPFPCRYCIDCLARLGYSLRCKEGPPRPLLSHRSACGAPSALCWSGESPAWHHDTAGR